MSKVTETLNNINKTKEITLSSQLLELGLIDDIKSEMKEANRGGMLAIDLANKAKKPAEDSLKLNKSLLIKIEQTEKKAKELGASDIIKTLNTQKKQVEENIKTINDILDALYKI